MQCTRLKKMTIKLAAANCIELEPVVRSMNSVRAIEEDGNKVACFRTGRALRGMVPEPDGERQWTFRENVTASDGGVVGLSGQNVNRVRGLCFSLMNAVMLVWCNIDKYSVKRAKAKEEEDS
jgi:hypothetical protein